MRGAQKFTHKNYARATKDVLKNFVNIAKSIYLGVGSTYLSLKPTAAILVLSEIQHGAYLVEKVTLLE